MLAKFKNDDISQFFYAYRDKPHLLSHVYKPREGSLVSLVYDHQDRLIFMSRDTQEFYIVTDRNGSPLLAITPEGIIMKELTRTPYGQVTYDSNRNLELPIGFHGGIYDNDVRLIHFQVIYNKDTNRKIRITGFICICGSKNGSINCAVNTGEV